MKKAIALLIAAIALPASAAEWNFLGTGQHPAKLADCPTGATAATITINTSAGSIAPWRRFCYYGAELREAKWSRKKRASTK